MSLYSEIVREAITDGSFATAPASPVLASSHCVWHWECPITVLSTEYTLPALIDWLSFSMLCTQFLSLLTYAHICRIVSPLSHISPSRLKNVAQTANLLSLYRRSVLPNSISLKIKICSKVFCPNGFSSNHLNSIIMLSIRTNRLQFVDSTGPVPGDGKVSK